MSMIRQIRKKYKPSSRLPVRNLMLWRDKHRCVYCGVGVLGQKWHADHQLAYSRGGKSHIGNLVVSCARCNMSKSYHSKQQRYGASFLRRIVAIVMYLPHMRLIDFL